MVYFQAFQELEQAAQDKRRKEEGKEKREKRWNPFMLGTAISPFQSRDIELWSHLCWKRPVISSNTAVKLPLPSPWTILREGCPWILRTSVMFSDMQQNFLCCFTISLELGFQKCKFHTAIYVGWGTFSTIGRRYCWDYQRWNFFVPLSSNSCTGFTPRWAGETTADYWLHEQ